MIHHLPPEILSLILTDLPSANDVRSLSLCNRTLHRFVQAEGWRIFNKSRFPSIFPAIPPASSHAEASQALTAHSRAWDRKALLARYLISPDDEREQSSNGWWHQ